MSILRGGPFTCDLGKFIATIYIFDLITIYTYYQPICSTLKSIERSSYLIAVPLRHHFDVTSNMVSLHRILFAPYTLSILALSNVIIMQVPDGRSKGNSQQARPFLRLGDSSCRYRRAVPSLQCKLQRTPQAWRATTSLTMVWLAGVR